MSQISLFRNPIVALTLTAFLSCAASAVEPTPHDRTDPRVAFDAFITAFNALDWESFRACFADDASLFNPDIPGAISLHRLDGRSEIERSFRVVFGSPPAGSAKSGPNIVPDNIRIQRFGETAILTFEFKRPNHSFGRRTIIMNRRSGDWRIVHIHASNVTE